MQFCSIRCKPNSQFCERVHDFPLGMLHHPAGLCQGRASPDLLLTEPLQALGRGWGLASPHRPQPPRVFASCSGLRASNSVLSFPSFLSPPSGISFAQLQSSLPLSFSVSPVCSPDCRKHDHERVPLLQNWQHDMGTIQQHS